MRVTLPVAAVTVVVTVVTAALGAYGWATIVGSAGFLVETTVLASSVRPADAAARRALARKTADPSGPHSGAAAADR